MRFEILCRGLVRPKLGKRRLSRWKFFLHFDFTYLRRNNRRSARITPFVKCLATWRMFESTRCWHVRYRSDTSWRKHSCLQRSHSCERFFLQNASLGQPNSLPQHIVYTIQHGTHTFTMLPLFVCLSTC